MVCAHDDVERLSMCCGAPLVHEEFCAQCLDHCGGECPACEDENDENTEEVITT